MFGSLRFQIYAFLGLVLLIFIVSLFENTIKSGQQWEIHFRFGPVPAETDASKAEAAKPDTVKPVGSK